MKYPNSIFIFIILTSFISGLSIASDQNKKEIVIGEQCIAKMETLDTRFYKVLTSSENDSINRALDLLKDVKKCPMTADYEAQIFDLTGEASYLSYKYSKDENFFEYALKSYNKALSFNTSRNELIYWHAAQLMRTKGDFVYAIAFINKVLTIEPEPQNPLPYLETAFLLAVDTNQWEDALGLMGAISKRDQRFYADFELLLASVKLLCHLNRQEDARRFIHNVEANVQVDSESDKFFFQESKRILNECSK